ncbi:MAG: DNA replication/repair protein RecF [Bacteroidales bacterium]|nr:DNA replication/repair protein RecF [Bacteroidales bacterium]
MILQSLSLTNFKNIREAQLELSPKFNCLLGDNGMGKSNLLDAIYFLSFCKSFTGATDQLVITRGEDFAILQAQYLRHAHLAGEEGVAEQLQIGMQRGRRKSLKVGGKEYKRLSEHVGKYPLVLISPADMDLVTGSGDERRRLMDMVISQTDARYLDAIIRYGQALEQRNSMLRNEIADPNLYLAIELAMDASASYICQVRRDWIKDLSAIFQRYYEAIAGAEEKPTLTYKSHLAEPGTELISLFNERRTRDAALGYTTAGPHRDDIEMLLSDMPVRRSASQGQAKTYTIALRLAQYEYLKQATGSAPLLLLDDIFDKLDATRVESIMQLVGSDTFGQIFITDTNRKNLDEILARSPGQYAMWRVQDGKFSPTTPLPDSQTSNQKS